MVVVGIRLSIRHETTRQPDPRSSPVIRATQPDDLWNPCCRLVGYERLIELDENPCGWRESRMQTELDRLAAQLGSWRWMLLVAAALDSGIVRALDAGPLGPDDLAGQLGLDPRATYVIAEALVEGGYLQGADGRWGLTGPARRLLLDETDPAFTAPSVLHGRDLASAVAEPARDPEGAAARHAHCVWAGELHATMALGARTAAPVAVAACLAHFPGARRVLDVGGGPGVYARAS